MAEVLTTDNKFNDWQNNGKDLGRVVMRKELYEKQGEAKSIDWEHLSAKWLRANNDVTNSDELGMGGDLIELDDKYSTYKIIPKEYSYTINTKLKGTFYVNPLGKVYYEHDKPLTKASEKEVLACVSPSILGYEFEIIDDLGTIIGWSGNATHLVIPAAFKMSEGGKEWCEPVRVIGAGAFQDGTFEKVTIPQSVEEIEDEAFQDGKLTEIEIPHSVETVGDNAFTDNPATGSGSSGGSGGSGGGSTIVKGSSDDRNISDSSFGGSDYTYSPVNAKDLDVITKTKTDSNGNKYVSIIGNTGRSYGGSSSSDSSLSNNSNTVINIPKELEINGEILPVTEIDSGAFQGSGLIDVIMPEGLLYIHDYAFAGNQLIRAIIPNSVIGVGNYAFAYNEIESKPTIDPINILQDKFTGNFGHVNNEGNISEPVSSSIDLKDHIFIISSMGNHVIEDVGANPEQPGDNDDGTNPEQPGDNDDGDNPEQPGDNNDGDVNNKVELMNPIEPREPVDGETPINSADELAKIGEDYPLDGKYILTSDIDLSNVGWMPIGSYTGMFNKSPFIGSFDGNGYKIINLTSNRPTTDRVGLFGYTEGATIKNVALEDINVNGGSYTGGLVGEPTKTTSITNSYATGSVTGTGNNTGGLVGSALGTTITNSYSTGSVTGTGNSTGGLVGYAHNKAIITNSYATGEVTGTGNSTGGLVGEVGNSTTITSSYATGEVTGTVDDYTGGLVGKVGKSNTITNSYATGEVTGRNYTGGLVGWAISSTTTIENSYATGLVTGTLSDHNGFGGLVGWVVDGSTVTNSYWDKEATGQTTSAGGAGATGKSTIQMKKRDTYDGWDFDTIWQIDEGQSYPTLKSIAN